MAQCADQPAPRGQGPLAPPLSQVPRLGPLQSPSSGLRKTQLHPTPLWGAVHQSAVTLSWKVHAASESGGGLAMPVH